MYFFYFDECGNPKMSKASLENDPWFVLAAAGFHDSHWRGIDSKLTEMKRQFFPTIPADKVEIKSTYIRSWGGPYPRWPYSTLTQDQVTELSEKVYNIFDDFPITLFFAVIQKAEHEKKYETKGHRPRHPYELAFELLVERIDWFLNEKSGEIGILVLDEQPGIDRTILARQLWYQKVGTWEKSSIDNIKEVPFFSSSKHSQLLTLPDLHAYNVYHRYRYDKPKYFYFLKTIQHTYNRGGKYVGYGLKKFP